MILPAFVLGLPAMGQLVRLTRSAVLEIRGEDFIRTAHSKGLQPRTIYTKHVLRNVAIPLVSVIGVQFGYMLGGSIIIETIFAWPGIGQLLEQAIGWRDYPLVMAIAVFTSLAVLAHQPADRRRLCRHRSEDSLWPLEKTATADSLLDVERTFKDRLAYMGRFLWRDRSGVIGLVMFLIVVFAAVFAPLIAPYDPLDQNLRDAKMPPAWYAEGSWDHPLGTDNLGRDLFSRLIYGARVSLTVGFFGVLIAAGLGMVFGAIAGYVGGRVDALIMGVVNLVLAAALPPVRGGHRLHPGPQPDQRHPDFWHHRLAHLCPGHPR